MDAAQLESLRMVVFFTSVMMLIDNLYSINYFQYTYLFELKRRFAMIGKGLPPELRMFVQGQVRHENGRLRNFIQSAYIPWFAISILVNMWYLPLIVTAVTGITNIIYSKPYISPLVLMINLLIFNCCYLVGALSLFLMK